MLIFLFNILITFLLIFLLIFMLIFLFVVLNRKVSVSIDQSNAHINLSPTSADSFNIGLRSLQGTVGEGEVRGM